MGYRQNCIWSHKHCHLMIVALLFLLVSSSRQVRFMAEGRANFKLTEITQMGREAKVVVRAQIGSRPPRCSDRCSSCGHCEAVQVPVVPQVKTVFFTIAYYSNSRGGGDSSNYKPMSWKCKCGDMIFNP